MAQDLPPDYFRSLRADYEIKVPETMSSAEGIMALERSLKEAIAAAPVFRERQPVETRWVGEPFRGRDLVFFDPRLPSPSNLYATLEFDSNERGFFVRDSSRQTMTREYICSLLDKQEFVQASHR